MVGPATLSLEKDGAAYFAGDAASVLPDLLALARSVDQQRAGTRLNGHPLLRVLLQPDLPIARRAASLLGSDCRPVRALFFDKNADTNWALGWHQDRTICVRRKIEHPGYGPWTIKRGMHHVAPPVELLARMISLRVHVDDVPETNAPLLIALGSHRLGRIAEREADGIADRHTVHACLATAGGIWAYSTPILHASGRSDGKGHRRVLQVDFSADELPGELEWLGV